MNRFLLPTLLELAVTNKSGRLAWDLYSGAGLFARALDFENVTAVESEGFSADDLKKNSETAHVALFVPALSTFCAARPVYSRSLTYCG